MKYVENRKEVLDREITGSVDRRSETESMEHEEHMQYRECMEHVNHMDHMEQNVWEALHMFRKTEYRKHSAASEQRGICADERHLSCAEEIGSEHGVKMSDLAKYTPRAATGGIQKH
ncbi:MAG: hypothetical protein ACLUD0_05340 [Eubacterium ramulus]